MSSSTFLQAQACLWLQAAGSVVMIKYLYLVDLIEVNQAVFSLVFKSLYLYTMKLFCFQQFTNEWYTVALSPLMTRCPNQTHPAMISCSEDDKFISQFHPLEASQAYQDQQNKAELTGLEKLTGQLRHCSGHHAVFKKI